MRGLFQAAALVLVFAVALPAAAQPPMPQGATDADRCTWEWLSAGGIGVWAERCDLDTGQWSLAWREELRGFVLTVDGVDLGTVLQRFDKPTEAGIDAILPVLRARGYIPDDGDCVFQAAEFPAASAALAFFDIQPTGARLADFEATPDDEVPAPPCGDYGWSTHGVRYFMTDADHPGSVVYIDIGQDGMMFDATTVTFVE